MTVMRHRSSWPAAWPDERIDRIFRDMFRDFFAGGAMMERAAGRMHPLSIEEFMEDDVCVIRAEMPGLDPDKDIEITMADGMLHIQAKREERKEEERRSGYHSEFHYGSFQRSVRLPEGTTETEVKASYQDGILEVRIPMPKVETTTPTKVPIKH